MTWLGQLQSLYSLDVLDTRFTISSSPTKAHDYERRVDPTTHSLKDETHSIKQREIGTKGAVNGSRWNTREFYFYYVMFLIVVPLMFKGAIDVSKGCP